MTTLVLSSLEFDVERYGVLMAPEAGNPHEAEGVLNPAGVAGPDGHYYLFPRLVAAGNVSRIGVGRLRRDARGRPCAVERLGIALAPSALYDRCGCEDARVTFLPALRRYAMCYTAWDGATARIALATSRDLRAWRKHGLVGLAPEGDVDFMTYPNKDAIIFPAPVRAPDGAPCVALLHRPIYQMLNQDEEGQGVWEAAPLPRGVTDGRPSLWLSYCPLASFAASVAAGTTPVFARHTLLARPVAAWEADRIGGGTVPLLVRTGRAGRAARAWLTFYHGVEASAAGARCYRAGALLLDYHDPRRVLARTARPLFGPEGAEERVGMVNDVVFVEAAQAREGGVEVYYGMADSRVGALCLTPRPAAARSLAA